VWFHASVPTPVREGSWQVALQDVFLLFNSENAAVLTDVHAWDGSDRFSVTGGLRVSGDRSHNPSLGTNAFQPRNADGSIHRMTFGLCVCMQFHFDADATVTFNSVGANFLYGG